MLDTPRSLLFHGRTNSFGTVKQRLISLLPRYLFTVNRGHPLANVDGGAPLSNGDSIALVVVVSPRIRFQYSSTAKEAPSVCSTFSRCSICCLKITAFGTATSEGNGRSDSGCIPVTDTKVRKKVRDRKKKRNK